MQCPGWRRPYFTFCRSYAHRTGGVLILHTCSEHKACFSAQQLNKLPAIYSVTVTPYAMTAIRERQPCSQTSFCGWLPATCFGGLNGIPHIYFNLLLKFTGSTCGHRSGNGMSMPASSQHVWRHDYLYQGTVNDARHSIAVLTELLLPIQLSWHVMLEEFHSGVSTERNTIICRGQAVCTTRSNTSSLPSDNNTSRTQVTNPGSKATFWPIPVAARHKEEVCGSSLDANNGSNPVGGMDGCRLCVVRGLCDGPIPHSEESYRLCAWHRVWTSATITLYSYSEYVEEVRLR